MRRLFIGAVAIVAAYAAVMLVLEKTFYTGRRM